MKLFEAAQVESLEALPGGKLEAQVWDGELYDLQLQVANEAVQQWHCSCGASGNSACAHLTAVIFKMVAGDLGIEEKANQASKRGRKPKAAKETAKPKAKKARKTKLSPHEQLLLILDSLPAESLRKLLSDRASVDPALMLQLLVQFADINEADHPKPYADLVLELIKKHRARKQQLDTHAFKALIHEMEGFMQGIDKQITAGNLLGPAYMLSGLFKGILKIMDLVYDRASLLQLMQGWVSLVQRLAAQLETADSEEMREFMLKSLLDMHDVDTPTSSWLAYQRLNLAVDFCATTKDVEGLEHELVPLVSMLFDHNLDVPGLEQKLLAAYEKSGGPAAARTYRFRMQLSPAQHEQMVKEALDAGAYEDVLMLMESGMNQYPPEAEEQAQFQMAIIKMLELMGRLQEAVARAKSFYLHARMVNYPFLLQFLHANMKSADWKPFLDDMLAELMIDGEDNFHAIYEIFRFENNWKGLAKFLFDWFETGGEVDFMLWHLIEIKDLKKIANEAADLLVRSLERTIAMNPWAASNGIVRLVTDRLCDLEKYDMANKLISNLMPRFAHNRYILQDLDKLRSEIKKRKR